jgi:predicted secreted protein
MEPLPATSGLVMLAGGAIVAFGACWYAIVRVMIAFDARSRGGSGEVPHASVRLAPVFRAARLTLAIWTIAGALVILVGWWFAASLDV